MAMGFQSARLVNGALQMSKSGQTLRFGDIYRRTAHTMLSIPSSDSQNKP